MPKTQKVWTDKQAMFWLTCFEIFIVGWFLAVVAGIYLHMGDYSIERQVQDLVYLLTLVLMFGFMLFGITMKFSWPAAQGKITNIF